MRICTRTVRIGYLECANQRCKRNLNIIPAASPHLIPQTFDIKPTAATLPPGQKPDELLIDWGNVPAGSRASIYLPGTSALSILSMADKMYSDHGLSHSDAHTITCEARGLTYVPIPKGIGSNYAGLLTVDLPSTVKRGEAFKVITRQVTNAFAKRPTPPSPPPSISARTTQAVVKDLIQWRKVLGTFQINISGANETTAARSRRAAVIGAALDCKRDSSPQSLVSGFPSLSGTNCRTCGGTGRRSVNHFAFSDRCWHS